MSLETLPLPATSTTGGVTVHECCCVDDRLGMCGTPLDDSEITYGQPTCVVCRGLLDVWAREFAFHGASPRRCGDAPCQTCPKRWKESGR
jgi:hypothetical protein